jgi:hypothetical protein
MSASTDAKVEVRVTLPAGVVAGVSTSRPSLGVQFEITAEADLTEMVLPEIQVVASMFDGLRFRMLEQLEQRLGGSRHVLRHPGPSWNAPYVVLRAAADVPDGWVSWWRDRHGAWEEGKWYDRPAFRDLGHEEMTARSPAWRATETERYEVREDGAAAQVYEVRPW